MMVTLATSPQKSLKKIQSNQPSNLLAKNFAKKWIIFTFFENEVSLEGFPLPKSEKKELWEMARSLYLEFSV
jgi:hypothetical protein